MLKQLISKDVYEYVEKNEIRISDFDLATIIYQSEEISEPTKAQMMQELKDTTSDEKLRVQLEERIAYDKTRYERFIANDGSCVFTVEAAEGNERWDRDDVAGYFASVDLALEYGKQLGISFAINKYQIIGLCKEVITPKGSINPRLFPGAEWEQEPYAGDPIGRAKYSSNRELLSVSSYEMTHEEQDKVDDWGESRFEWHFPVLPNPFEVGDIVRIIGCERPGVIATSQEEWKAFLQRVSTQNLVVDFLDASLIVNFIDREGKSYHGHIQPIYLEKIEVDDATKEQLLALL